MALASASKTCRLSEKREQRLSPKIALRTPKQLLHKKTVRTKTFNTIHQPWHQPSFSPHTSYTRRLLHQTPSPTPSAFYTKAPFTPNVFYNRQLLHLPLTLNKPDNFRQTTFKPEATRHLLHKSKFYTKATLSKHFTPNGFYAKETFTLGTFYTRHLWHQTLFTPNTFYPKQLLYQKPFMPDAFYTRNLLHQTPFP